MSFVKFLKGFETTLQRVVMGSVKRDTWSQKLGSKPFNRGRLLQICTLQFLQTEVDVECSAVAVNHIDVQ